MLAMAVGCGARRSLILDHDGAIDDYVALLMVAGADGPRLRAVTISFGGCDAEPAADATRRILAAVGAPAPVGVHAPSLRGKNEFPAAWRETCRQVPKLFPAAASRGPGDADAVAVLGRALDEGRRGIDILATGPLTNLAAAFREDPPRAGRAGRVVILGGAVRVPGNAPAGAEYNFFVDPDAAAYVLSLAGRGLAIDLVPLDATNQFPVTPRFVDRLLGARGGKARHAGRILKLSAESIAKSEYYLWDGAAALALLRPGALSFATLRLEVTPEGRTVESPAGHGPIRVALGLAPGVEPLDEVRAILDR